MKAFAYQMLYFTLLGPITPILMYMTEGNFNLADNMCFTLRGTMKYFLIQTFIWLLNIASIFFVVSRAAKAGESLFYVHNEDGLDLFIFIFVFA